MRTVAFGLLYVAFAAIAATAAPPVPQKANQSATVPKKIADKLKPLMGRIKATAPKVSQKTAGEFVNARQVASDVQTKFSISDYAEKPYKAVVSWVSNHQETRIYSTPEKAEAANDWLSDGTIAGAKSNAKRVPERFTATLFFVDGKWRLENIEWFADYGNIVFPPGLKRPGVSSTAKGDETSWQAVFDGSESTAKR